MYQERSCAVFSDLKTWRTQTGCKQAVIKLLAQPHVYNIIYCIYLLLCSVVFSKKTLRYKIFAQYNGVISGVAVTEFLIWLCQGKDTERFVFVLSTVAGVEISKK